MLQWEIKERLSQMRKVRKNMEGRILVGEYSVLVVDNDRIYRRVFSEDFEEKQDIYNWDDVIGIERNCLFWNYYIVFREESTEIIEADYIIEEYFDDPDSIINPDIKYWKNIKQLCEGELGLYGLDCDGNVHFLSFAEQDREMWHGQDCVDGLSDIKSIEFENNGILLCIGNDGKVKATKYIGEDDDSCWDELSKWEDIRELYYINGRVVGLKNDGTLIATRYIENEDCDADVWDEIKEWKDVVSFDFSFDSRILAINSVGEIYSTEKTNDEEKDTGLWEKVVGWNGIAYLERHCDEYIVGLKYDGTLLVAVSDEFKDEYSVIPLIEEAEDIEYIKECDKNRVIWVKSDGSLFGRGKLILDTVMDTLEMKIHI